MSPEAGRAVLNIYPLYFLIGYQLILIYGDLIPIDTPLLYCDSPFFWLVTTDERAVAIQSHYKKSSILSLMESQT